MTDKRISELTAASTIETDELIPIVIDPSTAPETQKITFANFIGGQYTAKGQIRVATADNTSANLTVGTNAQKLVADSNQTEGVDWVDDTVGFNIVIGSGLAVPATGVMGYFEVPFKMTVTSVRLVADASGSAVVDIWKDTYANFPPTDADTVTSATPPTITTAVKMEDSTLTNWTKTWNAGDWIGINLDSVTTCKQITLSIRGVRAI